MSELTNENSPTIDELEAHMGGRVSLILRKEHFPPALYPSAPASISATGTLRKSERPGYRLEIVDMKNEQTGQPMQGGELGINAEHIEDHEIKIIQ